MQQVYATRISNSLTTFGAHERGSYLLPAGQNVLRHNVANFTSVCVVINVASKHSALVQFKDLFEDCNENVERISMPRVRII